MAPLQGGAEKRCAMSCENPPLLVLEMQEGATANERSLEKLEETVALRTLRFQPKETRVGFLTSRTEKQ